MLSKLPESYRLVANRNPLVTALACITLSVALVAGDARADAYAAARTQLVAAYQQGDFAAMRAAAASALDARPGYPNALFNRAFAEVLDGDPGTALKTLTAVISTGVDFNVADIDEFAPLQALPGWDGYQQRVAELQKPAGSAQLAFSHDVADFVPEGIAIDADSRLYLGSIRYGQLVRIGEKVETLVEAASGGPWSVFGMRFDAAGHLWFSSAAVEEMRVVSDNDLGRTGLFRLNVDTGVVDRKALLPAGDQPKVLGDLLFVDDDTLYATESLTGALYRYSIAEKRFEELIAPGALRSMQGLVLDSSGEFLYVADYVGGLSRISVADGAIERVKSLDGSSLFGIDGLYRYDDRLIAIQNGIQPSRVIEWQLSSDGLGVSTRRILARNLPHMDEPTLGVIRDGHFYFVANSHWNHFDRDRNLPDKLSPPAILKTALAEPAGN